MSIGFRLALFLLAVAPVLPAATVDERLSQLEARVSEMQLLLEQLAKKNGSPEPNSAGRTSHGLSYQIRDGDSYWSIARRHKVTVEALTSANPGVHPRRLSIGRTITIPGGSSSSGASAATPQSRSSTKTTTTHRVRQGEVMGRIARDHGISLSELMAANPGIDPRRLRIGKILTIPGQDPIVPTPVETKSGLPEEPDPVATDDSEASGNPYLKALDSKSNRVQSLGGESPVDPIPSVPRLVTLDEDTRFSEIARQHQTTVAQLNQLNRRELSPDQMIKAGSQLYIPVR